MTYWLSIVRLVPDPARGEFINVGAVAGDDDGDWDARAVAHWGRAKKFEDGAGYGVGAVAEFIGGLEGRIENSDEEKPLTKNELLQLSREMRNIVQLSAPRPVAATSAAEAIDLAFRHLILDQPGAQRAGSARKPVGPMAARVSRPGCALLSQSDGPQRPVCDGF